MNMDMDGQARRGNPGTRHYQVIGQCLNRVYVVHFNSIFSMNNELENLHKTQVNDETYLLTE